MQMKCETYAIAGDHDHSVYCLQLDKIKRFVGPPPNFLTIACLPPLIHALEVQQTAEVSVLQIRNLIRPEPAQDRC